MVKLTIRGTLPGLNEYVTAERSNRYAGAQMKKRCEAIVTCAARSLGNTIFDKPVHMVYRWFEPNRRRDKDNICAFGRKVIQDALVRSGVLQNDGWAQIESFADEFYVDKKNPRIEVQIWEAGE
jgi:Holliday junction resolvase RusA-like endonuclease